MAKLTRDNGDRSTYVPQLLSGEVFDQAADQGTFSHFRGPDNNNHNWRGFQRSPVYKGDVMLFGLHVLSPKETNTGGVVSHRLGHYHIFISLVYWTLVRG